jgi:amino acid adenylation domain-containing protein
VSPGAPLDRDLPVSFAQRRLWFLDRLEPGNPFYNVAAAWSLRGRLDVGALEHALNGVVLRHEALRTRFVERDGGPRQVIAAHAAVPLERIDLTHRPAPDATIEARRLMVEEARRPFDLARGPLVRAHLFETREERVLLLMLHHIACDNWSVQIILRDLLAIYAARAAEGPAAPPGPPALAEPHAQYADFAAWQQDPRREEIMARELAWWRDRLAGAPGALALPADRPRPAARTYRGSVRPFSLPADLVLGLAALGRDERGTLFMTLLAGFAALLARHADEPEVVIGSPAAGRTRTEWEDVVGCFANTLVLRVDLRGRPSFRALVRRAREACIGAYANQEVPFERLVESLAPSRSLGHERLAQVMFQLLNAPRTTPRLPDLEIAPFPLDLGTSKFDLTVFLRERAGDLEGSAEYSTDLFEPETVDRLMERYAVLLRGAVARPDAPVADLPLLGPDELRRLRPAWSGADVARPEGALLHGLVAAQAARAPDALAVLGESEALTYADLRARAGRLARRLRRVGAGPDAVVGVCLERSPDLLVALLGVLESGAAWLPLDPEFPRERLAGMIADAAPRVILTDGAAAPRLPDVAGTPVHRLDGDWSTAGERFPAPEESPGPADDAVHPDNLAYVLFTSGSTGRPKGVMISHRGVCNRLLWMQETFDLTPADRVLQKTPFSFDVSVWELFWPLIAGAAVVLARPGGHRDPAYLARLIDERRITVLHFVPSMLGAFLEEPEIETRCAGLRRVVCSGEALPPAARDRLLARLPNASLHNLYGPTEASIDATWWDCGRDDGGGAVPIGRPIANMRACVLDPRLRPVPPGVEGELYLGGGGLARGYAGRPDLTAERFVPDPFAAEPGERLYRTGDRARLRAGGALEFLGRRDGQVKLRGVRIELGEIESALRDHRTVRDAAVTVQAVAEGDERLIAYIVPRHGAPDPVALRAALRERLPDSMIPGSWVRLAALPLTPSGKLDRGALPAPTAEEGMPAPEAWSAEKRSPTEAALARIWAEVLRLKDVPREADFFLLGGHSLLAVQVVSRVRAQLGVELPLRALFETPGLEALARTIERLPRAADEPGRAPLRALPREPRRAPLPSPPRNEP